MDVTNDTGEEVEVAVAEDGEESYELIDALRASAGLPPRKSATTPEYDRLVPLLAAALLAACKLDLADYEGHAPLVHEQWRMVNRVAGGIAAHVAALDPAQVDQAHLAGCMMEDVQEWFMALVRGDQAYPTLDGATMPRKIVGPRGLAVRLADSLVALGVGR